jgi:hypothetical protein
VLPEEAVWFDPELMPPVSMYVGGKDKLVDGRKLIERFKKVESEIVVLRTQVDEDYEHLDCIWSLDAVERVAKNIREDIWLTVPIEDVVVPQGCHEVDRGLHAKRNKGTRNYFS